MDADLLVVGDYCLDLIFTGLPGLPELGKEIAASGFDLIPGGSFNTAVCAQRLGVRTFWGCDFGNDDFSQYVRARALAEGLPADGFVRHERALRNVTVSLSYPENRAFVAYYDPAPAIPAGFRALAGRVSARALYVPGIYTGPLFETGILALKAKRMKLVMDGNLPGERSLAERGLQRVIRQLDLFLPNAREALCLTGETTPEAAARALGAVCRHVVVKCGADGALACWDGVLHHDPALPVHVVDTTGAGDAFNAGFLKAWLDSRTVAECLRWGNIVGGLSTTARGGAGRPVTTADVIEILQG